MVFRSDSFRITRDLYKDSHQEVAYSGFLQIQSWYLNHYPIQFWIITDLKVFSDPLESSLDCFDVVSAKGHALCLHTNLVIHLRLLGRASFF